MVCEYFVDLMSLRMNRIRILPEINAFDRKISTIHTKWLKWIINFNILIICVQTTPPVLAFIFFYCCDNCIFAKNVEWMCACCAYCSMLTTITTKNVVSRAKDQPHVNNTIDTGKSNSNSNHKITMTYTIYNSNMKLTYMDGQEPPNLTIYEIWNLFTFKSISCTDTPHYKH